MIHNLAVYLFRDPLIEAAIPCLVMKYGYLSPLCGNHRESTVCVSQNKQRIRLHRRKNLITPDYY